MRHFVSQILKNLSLHFWHKKKKTHIFIGKLHFKIDKKSPRFLHWHDTCYHDTMTSVCPKKCIKPKNNIPYRDLFWKNLTESINDLKTSCRIFFFIRLPYWFILKWKFNPCPQNYILRNFITNFCLLFIKIILNLPQGCTNEITSPQSRKILALTNKNDSTIIKQISDAKHSRTEYINTVVILSC